MVFFKDFNKKADDILKAKKFNFFKAIQVKVDQKNNFSWTAKTNIKEGKSTSNSEFVFEQKEDGLGKLKCTFKSADDSMSLEASSKIVTPLEEVKVKVEQEKGTEVSVRYNYDALSSKFTFTSNKDYSLVPNLAYQAGDFTFGAEAKIGEEGLKDYSLGMHYCSGSNQILSVQATNQLNDVTVSGYLDTSEVGKLCTQVKAKNVQGGAPDIKAEVGGIYGLNEKTNLRWKYAINDSSLAGVYEYKYRDGLKGSLACGYDMASQTLSGVNWKAEIQV